MMTPAARLLAPLAVFLVLAACGHVAPSAPPAADGRGPPPAAALRPSPNKLVGRVLAVDAARGFAFVDLTAEPPAAALADGAELIARTDDLRETARLRASRYVRGRTLGARIVSGQPAPGDEVVFFVP
jgi:hypothetical protein